MKTKNRKTIGVFIDWIESSYHIELISAIETTAHELGVNILTMIGGALNSSQKFEALCNIIYDFVNYKNVDGILIASGSLGHYCSEEELIQFCRKYHPLPVISISQALPGIVSIISDNAIGLKALLQHLITDHGYKKIGFIKGIEGNQDAEQRFDIYKQTLLKNNIVFNEKLVTPGDFTPETGRAAVRYFLKNDIKPEVLVAANDDMAIGAIEELQVRGIQVPYEIAVVGYDDQPASETITPPLTTVRQNISKQSIKALHVMLDILDHKKAEPLQVIPTELIIRQSCGCCEQILQTIATVIPDKSINSTDNTADLIIAKKEEILSHFIRTTQHHIHHLNIREKDLEELFDAFLIDIENIQDKYFLQLFQNKIIMSMKGRKSKNLWLEVLSGLIKATALYAFKKETLLCIENLFFQAQSIIRAQIPHVEISRKSEIDNQIKVFSALTEGIIGTVDIQSLMKLLSKAAPHMQIIKCYFAIFSKEDSSYSKLVLAYDRYMDEAPKLLGIEFPSDNFIPDLRILEGKPYNLRIHPFLRDGVFLGFTVFEFTPATNILQNLLRKMFLAGILKGVFIYETMKTEAERLEALVNERTGDLKQTEIRLKELNSALKKEKHIATIANENLQNTLNKLKKMQKDAVETEKMAALGSLVAGIAHEINTPIGIGVTAASHIYNETNSIYTSFLNQNMTKTELQEYMDIAQEASSMILSNLKRAYELIRSFKDIAVDQSSENVRQFNVKNYLQDVLLSLRPRLKKVKHSITINCPPDLTVFSYPGAFSQIITNLLLNSLIHGYTDDRSGQINFTIEHSDNTLHFIYSDDGKGIDPDNIDKIFNPFFTTNRIRGGTGLGLHLVYNIVKQRLGGTITCKSDIGKGVCFIITFPVNNYNIKNKDNGGISPPESPV
ncbi:MAG: substrate-binding domain-containing protein [Spirochaetales bacterium]|nr:substrate-binding domain-containing protein [Spirochaetales bacterium]